MFEEFLAELTKLRGKSVLVTTHTNADPDAVSSALIALRLSELYGAKPCVTFPQGISKLAREMLDLTGVMLKYCNGTSAEACFVVDASNSVQLGEVWSTCSSAPLKVLVDHHLPGNIAEVADLKLVDPTASSATELMVMLAHRADLRLSPQEATLASSGIYYDTRTFSYASRYAFKAMSVLLDWGCDHKRVSKALAVRKRGDLSLRMAVLKALSRLKLERACEDLLIVTTHVGSFESDVANVLLSLGADVALVISDKGGALRVSVRTSDRALSKGVRAYDISLLLAERLGGEGGGHEAAAMAHLKVMPLEVVVEEVAKVAYGRASRACSGR